MSTKNIFCVIDFTKSNVDILEHPLDGNTINIK